MPCYFNYSYIDIISIGAATKFSLLHPPLSFLLFLKHIFQSQFFNSRHIATFIKYPIKTHNLKYLILLKFIFNLIYI